MTKFTNTWFWAKGSISIHNRLNIWFLSLLLFHLKEIGSIRHRKYTCTDVSSDESLLLFFRTICVFENNNDRTLCKKCFNQEYTNALEYWRLQWQTHKISTRYLDSKIINDKINAAIICVNKNDELKTYVVGPVHDDRYVGYLSPLDDEKDNFKKNRIVINQN